LREAALRVWKKGFKGKKRPEGWSELLKTFSNNLPSALNKDVAVTSKVSFFFLRELIIY
jgi:hypothetical protein